MSNLNLEYYDGNSLFVYPLLKNLDLKTIDLLKNTKNFEDLKDKISLDKLYLTCPERINTISCFEFSKDDEVLEINSCFGVVTQFLCDRVKNVTAIEFAKQNADIIYERLKDRDNLEIIVGNISKMQFEKKFDYIILTDVLEFASFFFNSINPYREFINFCKNLLKPNGTLILQIFNRFGLKNWLGQVDEHTLKKFDGLCNYPKFSLKSFTKKELETLFTEIGFKYTQFYYPTPNHFYPNKIYSNFSTKLFNSSIYRLSYPEIIDEIRLRNEMETFADSFLVVAKKENTSKTFFYSQISMAVNTILYTDNNIKWSEKIPLNNKSEKYLSNMYEYYLNETERLRNLKCIEISLTKCRKKNDRLIFDWAEGKSLFEIYKEKYGIETLKNHKYLKKFIKESENLIKKIYSNSVIMDFNPGQIFSELKEYGVIKNVQCVKNANIDCNQNNIIKKDNQYTIIDYDVIIPFYLPVNFIVFAGIYMYIEELLFDKESFNFISECLKISNQELNTYIMLLEYMSKNIDILNLIIERNNSKKE